jgi:hypothetical protein
MTEEQIKAYWQNFLSILRPIQRTAQKPTSLKAGETALKWRASLAN